MGQQEIPQQHQQPALPSAVPQQPAFITVQPPVGAYSSGPPAPQQQQAPSLRYNQKGGRITGWLQILSGLASVVFGLCALLILFRVIRDPYVNFSHVIFGIICWPIWSGLVSIGVEVCKAWVIQNIYLVLVQ